MQQQPFQPQQGQLQLSAGGALFLCQAVAASAEVFLHDRFGRRYLGYQALAGAAVIPLYSLFWADRSLDALWCFWLFYMAGCLAARADASRRDRGGDVEHSYYSGRPRLMRLLRRSDETVVKRVWEPLVVILTGAAVLAVDEPLGVYLIAAGVGLRMAEAIKHQVYSARTADMNDAMFEQRQLMERFQSSRRR